MSYADAFEEEADSIIDSGEEAGHKIPEPKRHALVLELAAILQDAWEKCQQRVREVSDENAKN